MLFLGYDILNMDPIVKLILMIFIILLIVYAVKFIRGKKNQPNFEVKRNDNKKNKKKKN